MQLYCRQCGKEIQAENINIDKMIAKCSACNAVFSFADMYEGTLGKPKAKYEDLPIPDGITVQQEMDYLLIERKWSRTTAVILILFALIWNGMIWGIFIPSSMGADFNLFPIPFVLVGILLAYMGLGNLLNTTIIRVDNEALDIKHVPLPFPSKHMPVSDIQQLFTRQRISRSNNRTSVHYELAAIRNDGTETSLVENLEKAEFALFIEQEIENYLGIENHPVHGEYS